MKDGDKLLIAYRSQTLVAKLLDYLDAQPPQDTAHPQFQADLEAIDEIIEEAN